MITTTMPASRHLLAATAALAALTAACACSSDRDASRADHADRADRVQRARTEAAPTYAALAKAAIGWPVVTETRPCDDDAITRATPEPAAREIVMLYWEDLARAAGTATAKDQDSTLWTVVFSHDTVGRMPPPDAIDDTSSTNASLGHDLLQQRPYLGVLRPVSRDDGLALDPSTMLGGSARWAFVIFDVRAAAAVCWAVVDVTTSDSVMYVHGHDAGDDEKRAAAQGAIERDLTQQIEGRVRAVAPELSKALRLPDNFKY